MYLVQVAAVGLKARPVRADEAAIPPSALYPDMELTRAKSSSLPGYGSRSAQQTEAPKKKKWGWSIFKRSKAPANSSDEDAHKKGGRSKARERPVVDTLTPLQSDLSASQSSLTRKERREAILARAQARRHGPGSAASSSDEERDAQLPSPSPLTRRQHSSQDSLNGRPRSRSARTERFLQRRSRDEESLRREMALEAHPGATDHAHYSEQRRRPNPATPPELGVALRRHQSGSPGGPRAQSLLFGQCKLSTPPPPPPRNPLNRPLNALHGHEHRGRPTSLHAPGPMPALHDYQNVDEHGRLVAPRADNRAAAHHLPLPARVQSVVFPAPAPAPKSPSPFAGVERRPVWLAVKGPASATSPTSPPPLREFWRSRETHQSAPTTPKSARERLAPFQWTSATSSGPVKSPVQPAQHTVGQQQHHVRDLAKLKPSTDRHLEQAICELEQIYQSLHLDGDDELLDRAERRDLPTRHQQPNASGSESEAHQQGGVTSDLDTMLNWSVSGSFESLATGQRRRRSAVPDRIGDDMAVRRLAPRKSVSSDAHSVPAQSYLLVSPSVGDRERQSGGSEESRDSAEPDVVLDDVAFRHMRHAKQSLRVADPQPPFGIPVGPVAPASPSDYLHARVTPEQRELRPLLHPTRYPDLVRDDLAFRNLRKDAGHAQLVAARQLPGPGDADDVVAAAAARGHGSARSKKRAVRSLSANIAQLIKKDAARPSGGGGPVDALGRRSESESESESEEDERYVERNPFEAARAQSLSDLLGDLGLTDASVSRAPAKTPRAVKQRSESRRKAADEAEEVAVVRQTRPSPSWVERAKLTDDEERTPALAKLYPASAIWREKRAASEAPRPTEDSTETATQVGHSKPPSGASSGETSGGPTRWEESPLFQCAERPARSRSPADSSDSGQVSCCGREVRQILHEHIRRQEEEQQRPGGGRKRSAEQPARGPPTDSSGIDRSAARARSVTSPGIHRSTRENLASVGSGVARRMSSGNNNETAAAAGAGGTGNGNAPGAAEKRAERIARYKEERRKQLQARHAPAGLEHSSSSEDLLQEDQSYAKYKHRKQMQRLHQQQQQQETRTDEATDAANSNVVTPANGGIKRFIRRESPSLSEEQSAAVSMAAAGQVRSNRAARLRAAAATQTPPLDAQSALKKRLSVPTVEPLFSDGAPPIGEGVDRESVTGQVVMRQKAPSGREKDKSTKRKSNLNRALTEEQIVGPAASETQDDAGKRVRRRRAGEPGVSPSSAETDMNSSVDNARPADPQRHLSPAADLRAGLRKSSQPPAFIRGAALSHDAATSREKTPPPPPPASSSVPWRNPARTGQPSKADELTARIEALTAMANQTVAKVDRLTGSSTPVAKDPKAEQGSQASSVRAVASKLLNRTNENEKPPSPLPVLAGRRTPAKTEAPGATKAAPGPVGPAKNRQPDAAPLRASNAIAANYKPAPDAEARSAPVESSSVRAVQGILKRKVEGGPDAGGSPPAPSVRIRPELQPILRVDDEPAAHQDPVSILKRRSRSEESEAPRHLAAGEPTAHSILKKAGGEGSGESASRSSSPDPLGSILKRAAVASSASAAPGVAHDPAHGLVSSDPRPILKKRSPGEDQSLPSGDGPRPILKKKSSTDDELDWETSRPKPILKSGRRTSADHLDADVPLNAGRRRSTTAQEPEAPSVESSRPEEPALSVAERISSLETLNSSSAAPWRLAKRAANAVPKRRKSLDAPHPDAGQATPGLLEAVNRHLAATSQDRPTPRLNVPDVEDERDEHDPSELSLAERMKLFERPPAPRRPSSPRKAGRSLERFQTQPVTSREVAEALHLSARAVDPAVSPEEPAVARALDEAKQDGRESPSGLERIRGILRRTSTESVSEMKSILRSKSPSLASSGSPDQPRSILKRAGPPGDAASSSGSEEALGPFENDLAAKLLSVGQEAAEKGEPTPPPPEVGQSCEGVPESATESAATPKGAAAPDALCGQRSGAEMDEHQTDAAPGDSEGSSSGTEVTTKVTLRLGGAAGSAVSTVQESLAKVKGHKGSTNEESNSSGIAARLAALQKSGEHEWKKRIGKTSGSEADEAAPCDGDATAKAKSSIADRLKVLESAQLGWKARVHEPDAARFTVAGKMGQRPASVHAPESERSNPASPLVERKRKPVPKPVRVKMADLLSATDSSSAETPCDEAKPGFVRSTCEPNGEPRPPVSGVQTSASAGRVAAKVTSRVVAVPRPDDETFTSFFASSAWSLSQSTSNVVASFGEITAEDFDRVVISQDLIVEKRTVHVQRRKNASRNPVKSLILNTELLRDEYEEVDTGVAEREVQRLKLEQLARNSHLAVEALAGLASKEDFTSVALKSAADHKDDQSATYLLLVKGRRHVQTRLVEPAYASVNSGDCYVLVTPTDVVQFVGRYSNVIERAKCADVAGRVVAKRDLGCARAAGVHVVEEEKLGTDSFYGPSKRFWAALGRTAREQAVSPAGPPEEDEIYEAAIVGTNSVWTLNEDRLEPCEEYWGKLPQTEMLDKNKVFVFDFGAEMYVWSGKLAPLEARRTAMKLAKALWDGGCDYSECSVNPIAHRATEGESGKAGKRPSWGVLRSAKQHMEPVLFREKFQDWPDASGLIRVRRSESDEKTGHAVPDMSALQPCDARAMLDNKLAEHDLELEGAHLGRGVEYYDEAERRLSQISTLSVKVWHVLDYDKKLLDEASHGQFHERDTYVIRWQYRVTVTGRDLRGQPSQHGLLGRDRFCYFIWHGSAAPATEQGASALTTVELDEERGPHVRLQQGREPPAFLALFRGRMAVHSGKRGEPADDEDGPWRLFVVRGEREQEAHLLQVRRCVGALRSRGCLVLANRSTGAVFVWLGSKSLKHTRHAAAAAAAALRERPPPEMGFQAPVTVKEQYEGAESRDFWEGVGHASRVADRTLYHSLAECAGDKRFDFTPRLFHLTSWTGQFRAEEVASNVRSPQQPCPYPFLQEDLYGANQPALFLLDNEDEVWLWHGWWPDEPETENASTGSSKLRFNAERRCAMETAIEYCRLKRRDERPAPPAYLVSAGLEPLAFRALFPDWKPDERVARLNSQEGRSADETLSIREVLERLKRTTYALAELQVRPLPEGVDPTRLESYLSDDDFQATLGMSKDEFYALPAWKQSHMRKETGLF